MRLLYDIFILIFCVVYFPYIIFKRKMHRDFAQRFGALPAEFNGIKKPVWIHAVSVGEAMLAVKIAARIKKEFPAVRIVVTNTTETGNNITRTKGQGVVDGVFYSPIDLSWVVDGVISKIDPLMYIMVETEIWPNIIAGLSRRKVPVVMVNGRISDRSFRKYLKIRPLMRKILSDVDILSMQTPADAQRIIEIGAQKDKVVVAGNLKFDPDDASGAMHDFKKHDLGFSQEDDVLLAGSTHFNEEEIVIDSYLELKRRRPGLRLVIVPRHVERCEEIKAYIAKIGFRYSTLSDILRDGKSAILRPEIVLVDRIGYLKDIYKIATVVFVGGSLIKKGGQNPIEPARLGKPVVFGPYMFNFRSVVEILVGADAAAIIKNKEELTKVVEGLLDDPVRRKTMSDNSIRVINENAGALARTLECLGKFIKRGI